MVPTRLCVGLQQAWHSDIFYIDGVVCRVAYLSLSLSLSLSLMEHKQIYLNIYIYIYIYIMGYSGLPRIVLIQRLPDQVQEASFPHRPRWNEPSILPPIWKPHISLFTNPKLKCFSRGAQTNIVKREILKSSRGMSPIEQPQTKCKFLVPRVLMQYLCLYPSWDIQGLSLCLQFHIGHLHSWAQQVIWTADFNRWTQQIISTIDFNRWSILNSWSKKMISTAGLNRWTQQIGWQTGWLNDFSYLPTTALFPSNSLSHNVCSYRYVKCHLMEFEYPHRTPPHPTPPPPTPPHRFQQLISTDELNR